MLWVEKITVVPRPGEPEHELPQALALARVEAGRRLVEQQHRGLGEQPDRDVDPLLVAAREGPDLVVAALAEPGLLEHPLDRRVDVGDALEAGEQAQVLGHGQPPVERRLLRHPADLAGSRDRARVRARGSRRGSRAASSCRPRWGRSPPAARRDRPRTRRRAAPPARRSASTARAPRSRARPLARSRSPTERYYAAVSHEGPVHRRRGRQARAGGPAARDARAARAPRPGPRDRQRRELGRRARDHAEDRGRAVRDRRRRDHARQPRLPPPRGATSTSTGPTA